MTTTRRLFTPEEANQTLPFVRRVIRDIVSTHQEISELYSRWQRWRQNAEETEADLLERRIRALLRTRDEFVQEIEQVGCEFKDYQLGLVDFPAQLEEREVYLCWRLGESEVQYWHELDGGFTGRQPIEGFFATAART